MDNKKKAVLVGASGLIGSSLLPMLLEDVSYEQVVIFVRKKLDIQHPKLIQKEIDFSKIIHQAGVVENFDVAFCCLGTTMKSVKGNKVAFYEVDYTYCARFADLCEKCGIHHFLIVTAMGADEKSMFYYNRVKGQLEHFIKKLVFDTVYIFRPSLLLGNRKEKRTGEDWGKSFLNWFDFAVPNKYKGIEAALVAKAMHLAAQNEKKGFFVVESEAIKQTTHL
ncbi:MAG: oxidoreductase [Cytophagales bacterium]|nr:MAG: oxidoreductase [Cytophagales bacterium]TAF62292.1 MAG: oxidoreductase [Cytophagales bacterium]